ncbi:MAG TPA: hypothetical protein P5280_16160, partial [Cyclobacteriaceae bacterium]|nr:hypothetical protein [Cyclobacteriaceae bacterium]
MIKVLLVAVGLVYTNPLMSQNADSLAVANGGHPVVFKDDTLFYIYSKIGPYKPTDRVNTIQRRIAALMKEGDFEPDSLKIIDSEVSSDIWFKDRVVFSVTDEDALAEGESRKSLAQKNLLILRTKLNEDLKSRSIKTILLRT